MDKSKYSDLTPEEIERLGNIIRTTEKRLLDDFTNKMKRKIQCKTCKKNMGKYCGIEHIQWGRAINCPDYEKNDKL